MSFHHLRVGVSVHEVYQSLLAGLSDDASIWLAVYQTPPPVQQRAVLTPEETELVGSARAESRAHSLSFLDTLVAKIAASDVQMNALLDALLYHQPHPTIRTKVSRAAALRAEISQCCGVHPGGAWAAYSDIEIGCKILHVPMLDFQTPKSAFGLERCLSVSRKLTRPPFVIVASDRSYHLIGSNLQEPTERVSFLARSLLFCPIVDRAYVAHQLLEQSSALRVSPSAANRPSPTVAWVEAGPTGVEEP